MECNEDKLSRTGSCPASPHWWSHPRHPQGRDPVSWQLLSPWATQLAESVLLPEGQHRDVASGYFLQGRMQALQLPPCLLWVADKGS